MGRKDFDALEPSTLAGPERLVGFLAVEHVEFRRAFLNRRANRTAQGYDAHAVLRELRIESMLVQVETPVHAKAIRHRGNVGVQAEREKAKPSRFDRCRRDLVMKRSEVRSLKCCGPTAGCPSLLVKSHERRKCFLALRLGLDQLEAHVEFLQQRIEITSASCSLRGPKR